MNKLFTKIATAFVGVAMAVGVGVAVANNSEVISVHAAAGDSATGASFSTSADYYLKITYNSTDYWLTGTTGGATDSNASWGVCATSNTNALKFRLSGTPGSGKVAVIAKTSYSSTDVWLKGLETGKFQLATSSQTVYMDSSTGYIYASSSSAYYCQYNYNNGSGGFRWYNTSNNSRPAARFVEAPAAKTLSSIALTGTYPTSFYTGDTFSHSGMTVTATYNDTTTADVTSSATFSGYNMSTTGNQIVTVSYTESGTTKTATYGITVTAAPTAESAEVINDMTTKTYVEGTAYDVTGLTLRITYDNDDTRDFDFAEDLTKDTDYVLDHDNAVLGDTSLDITGEYLGCEFDFTVTGITVTAAPKVVTYTVDSKTSVATTGLAPSGSSATFAQTYSTLSQATNGNSFTLTMSGFSKGTIITGITLSMHSNTGASSSYGTLHYSADGGTNTYLVGSNGSGVQFNHWGDNTELTSSYKNVVISSNLSIDVSTSFTLVISCTSNSLYCNGYIITYDYATPTFVASPTSHEIYCGEVAESTITVANFDSDPTLEYEITSGSSYISDVEIGSFSNHQATVLIEGHSTNHGTAVVRVRDAANKTTYYADITVVVNEIPAYEIELSVDSYAYVGDDVDVVVTTSRLQGTGINWSVISGSVDSESVVSDDAEYMATITSAGTLTIKATDNGNAENYATVSVTVVGRLNAVNAPSETAHASELTFDDKYADGGEKVDGAASTIWTVESDGTESTYDSTNGIHYGTNSAYVQYVQLSTSSIATGANDTIKSIVVNTQDRATSKGSLTVTVGGVSFKHEGSDSVTVTGGPADYTFTGNGTGEIVVKVDRGSAATKAIYVKSVTVNYVTTGATSDIANASGMHLAQKTVIDYAEEFNYRLEAICVAYGSTDTADLTSAWSDLADQYDNWFNKGDVDLTAEEIAHAKALFANADSVDRNKTASADELQHMLAKYDWIVSHYDVNDFLADDSGTNRPVVQGTSGRIGLFGNIDSSNATAIIVIVSLVSITAIGGYFLLRKKKED